MSFNLIPSIIIILCIVGIFVLFVRRLPEIVQEQGQLTMARQGEGTGEASLREFSKSGLRVLWERIKAFWKKTWGFVLEAKDLQQTQAIAIKLNKIIPKRGKASNIGIFNQIKKAERLAEDGKNEQAEQTYFGIIRKHPHEYAAYEGLIKIYTEMRNYDDIVEILQFLITHNPDNDSYYAKLGSTYLLMRRFQDSIAAYQRALEMNALVPARYVNIAQAYKGLHEFDAAVTYFRKAIELEPTNAQYVLMLVDCLEKSGKIDEAVAALEKAEEAIPKDKEIKTRLAKMKRAKESAGADSKQS